MGAIVKNKTVEIEHHSSSSLVKVTFYKKSDDDDLMQEPWEEVMWFDYSEFEDLKKAVNNICHFMDGESQEGLEFSHTHKKYPRTGF